MTAYLDRINRPFSLMDVELVDRLSAASRTEEADLSSLLSGTLVDTRPMNAVTFVENHDTQDGQALGPPVLPWFKPLAYALVLLRREGYPCVFYGDVYGISGPGAQYTTGPTCGGQLGDFILARKLYAYGEEVSYFDFRTCVGWVRQGTWDYRDGCAVVMSNAGAGWKRMNVGTLHRGEVWTDVLGWCDQKVTIGDDGYGEFHCNETSVSIYVNQNAQGRDQFGKFKDKFKIPV